MPLDIIADPDMPTLRIISPRRFRDERGFFSEIWRDDELRSAGVAAPFVQENHALSSMIGTVRGMHFQIGASAQAKLVRCPRGSILDVVVDIRRGSPTFGKCRKVVLSAENWRQLFVPAGFAHGYCTLEQDSEVIYKVSAYYDPSSERGLAWDDPELDIGWPVSAAQALLVSRDRNYPRLAELPDYFPYQKFSH
ncbi:MAG: dTDP-4-dehydrorhamnose 3,5-epimerase [Xanthobacteraceae bacterium]